MSALAANTFSTVDYIHQLREVDFTEKQAETLAKTTEQQVQQQLQLIHEQDNKINKLESKDLATKGDVRETELILKKELRETELLLKKEIKETELLLKKEIKETELHLQNEIKETELHLQNEIKNVELKIKDVELKISSTKVQTLIWIGLNTAFMLGIMAKGFHWW